MPEKIKIELGPVQETMFVPLYARAVEARKKDPALVDKMAAEIIDSVDYDLSRLEKQVPRLSHVSMVMRALYIDGIIREFLKAHKKAVIVNIGCGMDTTFERVDNGQLRWFDLDLPDTMELRKKFMKESDRRRFITSSFLEPAWLELLKPDDGIFFISAGVFRYFTGEEVRGFLDRIALKFPGGEMMFDASSPRGLEAMKSMAMQKEVELMKWGIEAKDMQAFLGDRIKILEMDAFQKKHGIKLSMFEKMMFAISGKMMMHYMIHAKFA
jgi:O-methyltransferase involved in polyketide biosynthesis